MISAERLRSERERLEQSARPDKRFYAEVMRELEAARTRIAELERHAARYRWLREQDGSHGWYTVCGTIYGACRMALLDDLIDAAILRRLGGQTT